MFGPVITATLLSIPPLILMKYLDYNSKKLSDDLQKKVDEQQFKSMFITHKNRLCSPHLNTRLICGTYCSYLYLKNILNLINQAQESLCVCMYHIVVDDIYHAILNAHNRGIHVRVVSDLGMSGTTTSKVFRLFERDIPIKIPKVKVGLMHHKFIILDGKSPTKGKVLFGSMNYTINALINNWEYILLTNTSDIVKRFSEEFDFIWENSNFVYPNGLDVSKLPETPKEFV